MPTPMEIYGWPGRNNVARITIPLVNLRGILELQCWLLLRFDLSSINAQYVVRYLLGS